MPAISSFAVCQFQQFRIDHLIRFGQYFYQIVGLVGIVRCEESICGARFLPPAGTTNAVNVILGTGRIVEIDDKLDVFNV